MQKPKGNGKKGHDGKGHFTAGNQGGLENPCIKSAAETRAAMMVAVSQDDLRAIVRALVKKAKMGDTEAARLVLERLIGKPLASVKVEEVTPEARPMTPEEAFAAIQAEYRKRHPEARAQE
jgi:hypothetical protein